MSPGRLDRFLPSPRFYRCPSCGGMDVGYFGVVHHTASCPRNPCFFCSLTILPGEKRTTIGKLKHPVHYDCLADYELDRIEDQEARRA